MYQVWSRNPSEMRFLSYDHLATNRSAQYLDHLKSYKAQFGAEHQCGSRDFILNQDLPSLSIPARFIVNAVFGTRLYSKPQRLPEHDYW